MYTTIPKVVEKVHAFYRKTTPPTFQGLVEVSCNKYLPQKATIPAFLCEISQSSLLLPLYFSPSALSSLINSIPKILHSYKLILSHRDAATGGSSRSIAGQGQGTSSSVAASLALDLLGHHKPETSSTCSTGRQSLVFRRSVSRNRMLRHQSQILVQVVGVTGVCKLMALRQNIWRKKPRAASV